jgi:hypothetical protein
MMGFKKKLFGDKPWFLRGPVEIIGSKGSLVFKSFLKLEPNFL